MKDLYFKLNEKTYTFSVRGNSRRQMRRRDELIKLGYPSWIDEENNKIPHMYQDLCYLVACPDCKFRKACGVL